MAHHKIIAGLSPFSVTDGYATPRAYHKPATPPATTPDYFKPGSFSFDSALKHVNTAAKTAYEQNKTQFKPNDLPLSQSEFKTEGDQAFRLETHLNAMRNVVDDQILTLKKYGSSDAELTKAFREIWVRGGHSEKGIKHYWMPQDAAKLTSVKDREAYFDANFAIAENRTRVLQTLNTIKQAADQFSNEMLYAFIISHDVFKSVSEPHHVEYSPLLLERSGIMVNFNDVLGADREIFMVALFLHNYVFNAFLKNNLSGILPLMQTSDPKMAQFQQELKGMLSNILQDEGKKERLKALMFITNIIDTGGVSFVKDHQVIDDRGYLSLYQSERCKHYMDRVFDQVLTDAKTPLTTGNIMKNLAAASDEALFVDMAAWNVNYMTQDIDNQHHENSINKMTRDALATLKSQEKKPGSIDDLIKHAHLVSNVVYIDQPIVGLVVDGHQPIDSDPARRLDLGNYKDLSSQDVIYNLKFRLLLIKYAELAQEHGDNSMLVSFIRYNKEKNIYSREDIDRMWWMMENAADFEAVFGSYLHKHGVETRREKVQTVYDSDAFHQTMSNLDTHLEGQDDFDRIAESQNLSTKEKTTFRSMLSAIANFSHTMQEWNQQYREYKSNLWGMHFMKLPQEMEEYIKIRRLIDPEKGNVLLSDLKMTEVDLEALKQKAYAQANQPYIKAMEFRITSTNPVIPQEKPAMPIGSMNLSILSSYLQLAVIGTLFALKSNVSATAEFMWNLFVGGIVYYSIDSPFYNFGNIDGMITRKPRNPKLDTNLWNRMPTADMVLLFGGGFPFTVHNFMHTRAYYGPQDHFLAQTGGMEVKAFPNQSVWDILNKWEAKSLFIERLIRPIYSDANGQPLAEKVDPRAVDKLHIQKIAQRAGANADEVWQKLIQTYSSDSHALIVQHAPQSALEIAKITGINDTQATQEIYAQLTESRYSGYGQREFKEGNNWLLWQLSHIMATSDVVETPLTVMQTLMLEDEMGYDTNSRGIAGNYWRFFKQKMAGVDSHKEGRLIIEDVLLDTLKKELLPRVKSQLEKDQTGKPAEEKLTPDQLNAKALELAKKIDEAVRYNMRSILAQASLEEFYQDDQFDAILRDVLVDNPTNTRKLEENELTFFLNTLNERQDSIQINNQTMPLTLKLKIHDDILADYAEHSGEHTTESKLTQAGKKLLGQETAADKSGRTADKLAQDDADLLPRPWGNDGVDPVYARALAARFRREVYERVIAPKYVTAVTNDLFNGKTLEEIGDAEKNNFKIGVRILADVSTEHADQMLQTLDTHSARINSVVKDVNNDYEEYNADGTYDQSQKFHISLEENMAIKNYASGEYKNLNETRDGNYANTIMYHWQQLRTHLLSLSTEEMNTILISGKLPSTPLFNSRLQTLWQHAGIGGKIPQLLMNAINSHAQGNGITSNWEIEFRVKAAREQETKAYFTEFIGELEKAILFPLISSYDKKSLDMVDAYEIAKAKAPKDRSKKDVDAILTYTKYMDNYQNTKVPMFLPFDGDIYADLAFESRDPKALEKKNRTKELLFREADFLPDKVSWNDLIDALNNLEYQEKGKAAKGVLLHSDANSIEIKKGLSPETNRQIRAILLEHGYTNPVMIFRASNYENMIRLLMGDIWDRRFLDNEAAILANKFGKKMGELELIADDYKAISAYIQSIGTDHQAQALLNVREPLRQVALVFDELKNAKTLDFNQMRYHIDGAWEELATAALEAIALDFYTDLYQSPLLPNAFTTIKGVNLETSQRIREDLRSQGILDDNYQLVAGIDYKNLKKSLHLDATQEKYRAKIIKIIDDAHTGNRYNLEKGQIQGLAKQAAGIAVGAYGDVIEMRRRGAMAEKQHLALGNATIDEIAVALSADEAKLAKQETVRGNLSTYEFNNNAYQTAQQYNQTRDNLLEQFQHFIGATDPHLQQEHEQIKRDLEDLGDPGGDRVLLLRLKQIMASESLLSQKEASFAYSIAAILDALEYTVDMGISNRKFDNTSFRTTPDSQFRFFSDLYSFTELKQILKDILSGDDLIIENDSVNKRAIWRNREDILAPVYKRLDLELTQRLEEYNPYTKGKNKDNPSWKTGIEEEIAEKKAAITELFENFAINVAEMKKDSEKHQVLLGLYAAIDQHVESIGAKAAEYKNIRLMFDRVHLEDDYRYRGKIDFAMDLQLIEYTYRFLSQQEHVDEQTVHELGEYLKSLKLGRNKAIKETAFVEIEGTPGHLISFEPITDAALEAQAALERSRQIRDQLRQNRILDMANIVSPKHLKAHLGNLGIDKDLEPFRDEIIAILKNSGENIIEEDAFVSIKGLVAKNTLAATASDEIKDQLLRKGILTALGDVNLNADLFNPYVDLGLSPKYQPYRDQILDILKRARGLSEKDSINIWNMLKKQGIISPQGELKATLNLNDPNLSLNLTNPYTQYNDDVIEVLKKQKMLGILNVDFARMDFSLGDFGPYLNQGMQLINTGRLKRSESADPVAQEIQDQLKQDPLVHMHVFHVDYYAPSTGNKGGTQSSAVENGERGALMGGLAGKMLEIALEEHKGMTFIPPDVWKHAEELVTSAIVFEGDDAAIKKKLGIETNAYLRELIREIVDGNSPEEAARHLVRSWGLQAGDVYQGSGTFMKGWSLRNATGVLARYNSETLEERLAHVAEDIAIRYYGLNKLMGIGIMLRELEIKAEDPNYQIRLTEKEAKQFADAEYVYNHYIKAKDDPRDGVQTFDINKIEAALLAYFEDQTGEAGPWHHLAHDHEVMVEIQEEIKYFSAKIYEDARKMKDIEPLNNDRTRQVTQALLGKFIHQQQGENAAYVVDTHNPFQNDIDHIAEGLAWSTLTLTELETAIARYFEHAPSTGSSAHEDTSKVHQQMLAFKDGYQAIQAEQQRETLNDILKHVFYNTQFGYQLDSNAPLFSIAQEVQELLANKYHCSMPELQLKIHEDSSGTLATEVYRTAEDYINQAVRNNDQVNNTYAARAGQLAELNKGLGMSDEYRDMLHTLSQHLNYTVRVYDVEGGHGERAIWSKGHPTAQTARVLPRTPEEKQAEFNKHLVGERTSHVFGIGKTTREYAIFDEPRSLKQITAYRPSRIGYTEEQSKMLLSFWTVGGQKDPAAQYLYDMGEIGDRYGWMDKITPQNNAGGKIFKEMPTLSQYARTDMNVAYTETRNDYLLFYTNQKSPVKATGVVNFNPVDNDNFYGYKFNDTLPMWDYHPELGYVTNSNMGAIQKPQGRFDFTGAFTDLDEIPQTIFNTTFSAKGNPDSTRAKAFFAGCYNHNLITQGTGGLDEIIQSTNYLETNSPEVSWKKLDKLAEMMAGISTLNKIPFTLQWKSYKADPNNVAANKDFWRHWLITYVFNTGTKGFAGRLLFPLVLAPLAVYAGSAALGVGLTLGASYALGMPLFSATRFMLNRWAYYEDPFGTNPLMASINKFRMSKEDYDQYSQHLSERYKIQANVASQLGYLGLMGSLNYLTYNIFGGIFSVDSGNMFSQFLSDDLVHSLISTAMTTIGVNSLKANGNHFLNLITLGHFFKGSKNERYEDPFFYHNFYDRKNVHLMAKGGVFERGGELSEVTIWRKMKYSLEDSALKSVALALYFMVEGWREAHGGNPGETSLEGKLWRFGRWIASGTVPQHEIHIHDQFQKSTKIEHGYTLNMISWVYSFIIKHMLFPVMAAWALSKGEIMPFPSPDTESMGSNGIGTNFLQISGAMAILNMELSKAGQSTILKTEGYTNKQAAWGLANPELLSQLLLVQGILKSRYLGNNPSDAFNSSTPPIGSTRDLNAKTDSEWTPGVALFRSVMGSMRTMEAFQSMNMAALIADMVTNTSRSVLETTMQASILYWVFDSLHNMDRVDREIETNGSSLNYNLNPERQQSMGGLLSMSSSDPNRGLFGVGRQGFILSSYTALSMLFGGIMDKLKEIFPAISGGLLVSSIKTFGLIAAVHFLYRIARFLPSPEYLGRRHFSTLLDGDEPIGFNTPAARWKSAADYYATSDKENRDNTQYQVGQLWDAPAETAALQGNKKLQPFAVDALTPTTEQRSDAPNPMGQLVADLSFVNGFLTRDHDMVDTAKLDGHDYINDPEMQALNVNLDEAPELRTALSFMMLFNNLPASQQKTFTASELMQAGLDAKAAEIAAVLINHRDIAGLADEQQRSALVKDLEALQTHAGLTDNQIDDLTKLMTLYGIGRKQATEPLNGYVQHYHDVMEQFKQKDNQADAAKTKRLDESRAKNDYYYHRLDQAARQLFGDGMNTRDIIFSQQLSSGSLGFAHPSTNITVSTATLTPAFSELSRQLKAVDTQGNAIQMNTGNLHTTLKIVDPMKIIKVDRDMSGNVLPDTAQIQTNEFYDWLRKTETEFKDMGPVELHLKGAGINPHGGRMFLGYYTDNARFQQLQEYPWLAFSTQTQAFNKQQMKEVFGILDQYRDTDFGTMSVTKIPLTINLDSFNRSKETIAYFDLEKNTLVYNGKYFDDQGKLRPDTELTDHDGNFRVTADIKRTVQ